MNGLKVARGVAAIAASGLWISAPANMAAEVAHSHSGAPRDERHGGRVQGRTRRTFALDTFQDRTVLIRGVWSDITPNSHHFEQAYCNDRARHGGQPLAPT
jgi:hypothetical protein